MLTRLLRDLLPLSRTADSVHLHTPWGWVGWTRRLVTPEAMDRATQINADLRAEAQDAERRARRRERRVERALSADYGPADEMVPRAAGAQGQ